MRCLQGMKLPTHLCFLKYPPHPTTVKGSIVLRLKADFSTCLNWLRIFLVCSRHHRQPWDRQSHHTARWNENMVKVKCIWLGRKVLKGKNVISRQKKDINVFSLKPAELVENTIDHCLHHAHHLTCNTWTHFRSIHIMCWLSVWPHHTAEGQMICAVLHSQAAG